MRKFMDAEDWMLVGRYMGYTMVVIIAIAMLARCTIETPEVSSPPEVEVYDESG